MDNVRQKIEQFLEQIENETVTQKNIDIEQVYILLTHAAINIDRLTRDKIALGWQTNPDRMGGQFTDEEINRPDRL
jgi:hypothetical protein